MAAWRRFVPRAEAGESSATPRLLGPDDLGCLVSSDSGPAVALHCASARPPLPRSFPL